MQYKIRVDSAEVEVYEDDYERGELGYVNRWTIPAIEDMTFNDVNELVKAISNSEPCFSANASDYFYFDGSIATDSTINSDNVPPTDEEYEQWKRDEIMLYTARLTCYVTMVPAGGEHKMTPEEAKAFGLEVY